MARRLIKCFLQSWGKLQCSLLQLADQTIYLAAYWLWVKSVKEEFTRVSWWLLLSYDKGLPGSELGKGLLLCQQKWQGLHDTGASRACCTKTPGCFSSATDRPKIQPRGVLGSQGYLRLKLKLPLRQRPDQGVDLLRLFLKNIFIDYAITVVPFPPLHSIVPTPPHIPPL